jgi:plasmid stabilization system protein ParE
MNQPEIRRVRWYKAAQQDFERFIQFKLRHSVPLAESFESLGKKVERLLLEMPRLGEPLAQFLPKEVRRWLEGDYEFRYEIRTDEVVVLRVFHTKEDR